LFYDKNNDDNFWRFMYNPNTPQYIKDLHKFKKYLRYYD
jgi:hypothetical protein